MPRKLNPSEFYELIAKKINVDEERAKIVWQDIMDVVANEVLLYGTISLPYFGTVKSQIRGGKVIKIPVGPGPENKGKVKEMYVEPYWQYTFKMSETFVDIVNGRNATMSQKRRQREAFRQVKRQEELRKEQFVYMEKAERASEEMKEKWKARKEREKRLRKMSKKRREAFLKEEGSYWDELEEAEELEQQSIE